MLHTGYITSLRTGFSWVSCSHLTENLQWWAGSFSKGKPAAGWLATNLSYVKEILAKSNFNKLYLSVKITSSKWNMFTLNLALNYFDQCVTRPKNPNDTDSGTFSVPTFSNTDSDTIQKETNSQDWDVTLWLQSASKMSAIALQLRIILIPFCMFSCNILLPYHSR